MPAAPETDAPSWPKCWPRSAPTARSFGGCPGFGPTLGACPSASPRAKQLECSLDNIAVLHNSRLSGRRFTHRHLHAVRFCLQHEPFDWWIGTKLGIIHYFPCRNQCNERQWSQADLTIDDKLDACHGTFTVMQITVLF